MGNINSEELLQLISEGKNQKEAAKILSVSEPAVSKKLKKLLPPPETPNFEQLSDKQKLFVIEKAKGKSNIQAVVKSHDVTTKGSAKSLSSQLMAMPEIQMSLAELMDHCGIDKPYRIRRLKQIIDSKDLNIAHKGLDMSWKLSGDYSTQDSEGVTQLFGKVIINQFHNPVRIVSESDKNDD